MRIIINIGRVILQLIFDVHTIAPVKNRITIISRQSNTPSLDIRMLTERLQKELLEYEVTVLCRKLDNKVSYVWHMITTQMHSVATSRAVVLDSYCILISFLRQRSDLKVLQMWHALGAYKKFGKSILGQAEGSSQQIADIMNMHRGYDAILASSEAGVQGFKEAFGYDEDYFRIIPLPRTDLLRDPVYKEKKRAEILSAYPELAGKEIILYAPTLRKGSAAELQEEKDRIDEFIRLVDKDRYSIILSGHPVVSHRVTINGETPVKGYTSMELLTTADHFVTDYSAMLYEAAVMGVRTYIYAYDLDNYIDRRGFYLNPYTDLPSYPHRDPHEVIREIGYDKYDFNKLRDFAERNVVKNDDCTGSIVNLIKEVIHEA